MLVLEIALGIVIGFILIKNLDSITALLLWLFLLCTALTLGAAILWGFYWLYSEALALLILIGITCTIILVCVCGEKLSGIRAGDYAVALLVIPFLAYMSWVLYDQNMEKGDETAALGAAALYVSFLAGTLFYLANSIRKQLKAKREKVIELDKLKPFAEDKDE